MKSVFKSLALAALLCPAIAAPAQASEYPTEIAVGPVIGVTGPGLAWRQFPLPWLGYQLGANTWGIGHFAGGAVLLSPYHDQHGQRLYATGGVAVALQNSSSNRTEVYPAFGLGASRIINDQLTFFIDVSVFELRFSRSTVPLPAPQLGFLYTF